MASNAEVGIIVGGVVLVLGIAAGGGFLLGKKVDDFLEGVPDISGVTDTISDAINTAKAVGEAGVEKVVAGANAVGEGVGFDSNVVGATSPAGDFIAGLVGNRSFNPAPSTEQDIFVSEDEQPFVPYIPTIFAHPQRVPQAATVERASDEFTSGVTNRATAKEIGLIFVPFSDLFRTVKGWFS